MQRLARDVYCGRRRRRKTYFRLGVGRCAAREMCRNIYTTKQKLESAARHFATKNVNIILYKECKGNSSMSLCD